MPLFPTYCFDVVDKSNGRSCGQHTGFEYNALARIARKKRGQTEAEASAVLGVDEIDGALVGVIASLQVGLIGAKTFCTGFFGDVGQLDVVQKLLNALAVGVADPVGTDNAQGIFAFAHVGDHLLVGF